VAGHAVLSVSMQHRGCKKLSHCDCYTRSEREESSSSQWHQLVICRHRSICTVPCYWP